MNRFGIGQPVRRAEDRRFITGRGRFVDDIDPPHQCYGAVVMPPHARVAEGVLRVLTGAGTIGAPPAVINALLDALGPMGVDHIDMPATPRRIREAMNRVRLTGESRG